jgi:hypothetical protein
MCATSRRTFRHHFGTSDFSVQRDLIDHEERQRRVRLAQQDAALPVHP